MRIIALLSIIIFSHIATAQNFNKIAYACHINNKPKIDGIINENVWLNCSSISDFKQYDPYHGKEPSNGSKIFFAYDNSAIYIAAKMYDSAPDSILTQLGNRDDDLNADWISFKFDTYANQQDAYIFEVTASGVQRDHRAQDWTYDAVWESAVSINKEGWSAEIRIPFSAIRFPKKNIQEWGLQILRGVKRKKEKAIWAFMEKGTPNYMSYWGVLKGINNIETPLRLSLKPHISSSIKKSTIDNEQIIGKTVSGGMALNYGINESFSIGITLLPDFSQIKSDKEVKNLSAFETIHSENRPFFKESMDLFRKGGLFYSRRIGQQPSGYNSVYNDIDSTMQIKENPAKAKLVNATKFYGRNKNGVAIGVLNAITSETNAIIGNRDGSENKITTEPLTNYNITVVDKSLKNNSSAYFINTNVIRKGHNDKANVTGFGTNIQSKSNKYSLNARGSVSQNFNAETPTNNHYETILGYQYYLAVRKIAGNFRFNVYRDIKDDNFEINDLGITHRNNYKTNGVVLNYIEYEPFWHFRYFSNHLRLHQTSDYTTNKNIDLVLNYGGYAKMQNYLNVWYNMNYSVKNRFDYYDPRSEGRYIIRPPYFNSSIAISSDYRKIIAIDGNIFIAYDKQQYEMTSVSISPKIRFNDKFSFDYKFKINQQENSLGYVTKINDNDIIYGKRDLLSYENSMSSKYIIRNNLSINLWMRHYWYQGEYKNYFNLEQNGNLSGDNEYTENNNFNFNTLNMDLQLNWEFAPGSEMCLVWKNSLKSEQNEIEYNFYNNMSNVFDSPKTNIFSIKVLYYLDYQNINLFNKNNKSVNRKMES